MRIVINGTAIFRNNFSVENRRYFAHCLDQLAKEKPQVDFWFLTDQYASKAWQPAAPAKTQVIRKSIPGRLGTIYWSQWQLVAAINRLNPDLYLSLFDKGPNKLKVPQCLWIFNNADHKDSLSSSKEILRFMMEGQERTTGRSLILTGSQNNKLIDQEVAGINKTRVSSVPLAADKDFESLPWTEKENIKVKYAGGKEFFVTRTYFGESALIVLLKAFSLFKKRQQSNMQLLITGMEGDLDLTPFEKLENYKFRNDVHAYPRLSEQEFIRITASAYAFIQPVTLFDGNAILNAFQAQVPVISTAPLQQEGIAGDAVLFAKESDHEQLADQLMLLFKDEVLRNELIRKGKIKARQYNPEQSVKMLWKGMMLALSH